MKRVHIPEVDLLPLRDDFSVRILMRQRMLAAGIDRQKEFIVYRNFDFQIVIEQY